MKEDESENRSDQFFGVFREDTTVLYSSLRCSETVGPLPLYQPRASLNLAIYDDKQYLRMVSGEYVIR